MARSVQSPGLGWIVRALTLAAFVMIALPPLTTRWPPLLDYPNHYARYWLLADGLGAGPAAGMFAADFQHAWTNVGLDLLAWALGPVASSQALGPAFVLAAVIAPPLGALLLHRRLYGGGRWWPVMLAASAWTVTLIAGLLNYQVGLGLALTAAAADPWLQRRPAWLAGGLRVSICLVLIATHVFALFFYAALLAGLAVGPDLRAAWAHVGRWRQARRTLVAVAPALLVVLLFWLFAPARPAGPMVFADWSWDSRLYLLMAPITTYQRPLEAAIMAPAALLLAGAAATGRLRAHGGLVAAGLMILALAMAAPAAANGAYWVNLRLPIMSLLILMAAVDPRLGGGRWAAGLAAAGLAVVTARTALVAEVWRHRQTDYAALERVLAHLPPGASLLPLRHDPTNRTNARLPPGRWFYGGQAHGNDALLAVPLRQAFVPTIFATRGQQPLQVRPAWASVSFPGHAPANIHALDGRGGAFWKVTAPYAACWRTHFDYALVTNADVPDADGPAVIPPELTLVADAGYARLYRIARTTPFGPNPAPCRPPT